MSDSQAYDTVQVSSDGVTVTKRFEADEFPVPAIAFEFESERDESVLVKLIDAVPEGVEVEDLGFHPEYGSEFWTIENESISFERDMEAGASYTTVYGIRAADTDNIEQFLDDPTLERVEPPLPDDGGDLIRGSGDNVIKDAIAGDGEIPGLDDEDEESEDESAEEDVGTLDLKDPNTERETRQTTDSGGSSDDSGSGAATDDSAGGSTADSAGGAATDDSGGGVGTDDSAGVSVDESVVSALAEEIRQGAVSAEDVKLLRRAFEVAGQEGGTINAQIRQIQTDIADLRAYTGSLEEFLAENGTGKQLIEEFEGQLDSFRDQLDSFEGQLDELEAEFGTVRDDVGAVQTEMNTVSEEVETVSEEVDSVGEEVDSVGEEVDSVGEELDQFGEDIETVTADMDSLEATIADIEGEIEEIREEMTDADVGERVDSMEADIKDLKSWQKQIKQTFGG